MFAPFLIIITSPRLLLGDVLLFYVSFSLLLLWLLNIVCETYYFCSVYYYYYYYYGFQTKFVRHIVFALFLLIIIIIMAPKRSLWDILLLLCFLLLWLPNVVCETYYFCSVSYYYYYINPTAVGWCIAILRFFFPILIILILPHNFVRHFSRRFLDQTLWNLVGISYAMWSCAFKCWFFQNGCRCHGNGQNAKKLKKHKNDHSRLLAEQKLMKLDRNNIHI